MTSDPSRHSHDDRDAMNEPREQPVSLRSLLERDGFAWLAGIEDTFVTAPHPTTGRTLDEYELTGHYDVWRSDLDLMARTGVRAARCGLPWHRLNPAPGRWDFAWCDAVIDRLLELGVAPVLDLVHYGVPGWIEGAFVNPDYDRHVEEYAARVLERYGDRVDAVTPLNEPRITAWYTGKLGWWPPYRRGWRGFFTVLVALCRGIVRVTRAIERTPGVSAVHVDAADLYLTEVAALRPEAEQRQAIGFLALDLVTGKVNASHPLHGKLLASGVTAAELAWFEEHAITLDFVGLNLYPLFSGKHVVARGTSSRIVMRYATATVLERLCELYHERYGRPILITETATEGSVARRQAWLDSSVAAVGRLRARGVPVVGYTWWPLFALVSWAYRQSTAPVEKYLKQMGLYDVVPRDNGELERVATPLVERYRGFAARGGDAVGPLSQQGARAAGGGE